jgi:SPP1 gp7 family putative phage head morphogenesis protein
MNAKFWGKSVIELNFEEGKFEPYNIPRKHLRVDKGLIVINPNDETGIPYKNDDFFIEAGKDKDFGLILRAAPFVIYKRGNFGDWAQFAELFGMPYKVMKYAAQDEESRKILEQAAEKSGSSPWMVIPKETDIELTANSGASGNGLLYDKLKTACNEEILIGILGQTMTTLNGSSRSQSETHMEVQEGKHKSDRRFVQRILNRELLPRLEKRGFSVKGGLFHFPDAGETLTVKEQLDIIKGVNKELGLPVDDDYIYDTFSIPKPKGVKKDPPGDQGKNQQPPQEPAGGTKKSLEEDEGFWIKLKERILNFFPLAPAGSAGASHGHLHFPRINLADLPAFDQEALFKRVTQSDDTFDIELFRYFSENLNKAISAGFLTKNFAYGIDYGFEPDALKIAMQINLFQFSAAKSISEIYELNKAFRSSKSFAEFRQKAEEISGAFNDTWLRTEYDTAMSTAEGAATYSRLINQAKLFPYWEYVTAGDDRVREEHRKLAGIILPVNDPRWKKIFPPNGWNCRCYIVPRMAGEVTQAKIEESRRIVDEYFGSPEWKKNKAQGFAVNKGMAGEIFSANQMYIKKFPTKASKYLGKLFYNDWNLPEIRKAVNSATESIPAFTGKPNDWYSSIKNKSKATLTDYQGRNMILDSITFRRLSNTHDKASLINAAQQTARYPDEVWLNDFGGKFNNLVMIKYYQGYAIALVTELINGKYKVKTWFSINLDDNNKNKLRNARWMYRRGLLVYNK